MLPTRQRSSTRGKARQAIIAVMLVLGLLSGGCASTVQAASECPTDAWWWPGNPYSGNVADNPVAWAAGLGVWPLALGVCTAVNQIKAGSKPSAPILHTPTIEQWCQQPESAGDEACPVH
jgi:hypothetical protein